MWRRWIPFLICAGALVLVDAFLWQASALVKAVGNVEGLSTPIDRAVNGLVEPSLRRAELEEELRRAETLKDYGPVWAKLTKQLGDMGQSQERHELLLQIVDRYGDARDKHVVSGYQALVDHAKRTKDAAARRKYLEAVFALAVKEPVDEKLLGQVLGWIADARMEDLQAASLESLLEQPGLTLRMRGRVLHDLLVLYKRQKREEDAARLQEEIARLNKVQKAADLARQAAKRIDDMFRKKRAPADILEAIEVQIQTAPDPAVVGPLRFQMLKVLELAAKQADEAVAEKALGHMKEWKGLPNERDTVRKADAAADHLARLFLAPGKDPARARLFLETMGELLPEESDMRRFVRGEAWARSDRAEPPPKRLYRVAHVPAPEVTVDGRLDEAIYQKVQPIADEFYATIKFPAGPDTLAGPLNPTAYLFYSDDSLYVAIRLPEPYPGQIRVDPNNRKMPWKNDSVEFFLDTQRDLSAFFQWIEDAGDFDVGLKYEGGNYNFNGYYSGKNTKEVRDSVEKGVHRGKDFYSMELRIPLEQLELDGSPKGRLMNSMIRRLRYLSADMAETSKDPNAAPGALQVISWTDSDAYHQPHRWNFLLFE